MEGHNDGEVWGLDMANGKVITTGDDNQVKIWDPYSRKCGEGNTAIVNTAQRKARKNKASTLGQYPDSQASRAVAISVNGDVVCAANDGSLTCRKFDDLKTINKEIHDSQEWIEVMEFSPDGQYLAVGGHDTNIWIYNVAEDYSLVGKCVKHNAALTCIDWSMDGSYIRSVCNAYELLFLSLIHI